MFGKKQAPRRAALVDPGRIAARLACLLFGVLGALSLSGGYVARSEFAQRWVSQETARVLERELGISASYVASISLIPLEISLLDVRVASHDPERPALQADRVRITPRVFSLIAGRLDIGDIEIERAEHYLVFEDGKLSNLDYRLPETTGGERPQQAPFRSLSATDTRFSIRVGGVAIETGSIDLDVFTEGPRALEIALRAGESRVIYPPDLFVPPPDDGHPRPAQHWDEDTVCRVEARVRLDPDGVLVRRLSLLGHADIEPGAGTRPDCPVSREQPHAPGRVTLRSSQLRIVPDSEGNLAWIEGRLESRAPLQLLNRLTGGAPTLEGWATVSGDVRYDGSTRLPAFSGKVTTGEFWLAGSRLVESSQGDVRIEDDELFVPRLDAIYGGGPVEIHEVTLAPFKPGIPLRAKKVDGSRVTFAAMMRDIGITPNTIVNWMLDRTQVMNFGGTLDPPKLDGDVLIETSGFEVFDRAYHHPQRRRMIGASPKAVLRGRFGVREDSIQFDDMDIRFGTSQLHASVQLGFSNWIRLQVPESTVNLAEISPLVTVPLEGIAKLSASMDGEMGNPTLVTDLAIERLVFAGYPIGNLQAKKTTFRPLWVEIADGHVQKGDSSFAIPRARLNFDGDASVEVDLQTRATGADVRDFLAMWKFDQDPGWKDLKGSMTTEARVRYVLGGPRDRCGEGDLRVDGQVGVERLTLFDENYDDGEADFNFHWSDIAASYRGMRLELPTFLLHKGAGSLLGNLRISPGAKLQGTVVATNVPLNRVQALPSLGRSVAGSVSAVIQLGGSLDALEARARTNVTPLAVGRSILPASELDVHLKPSATAARVTNEISRCGQRIPAVLDPAEANQDPELGVFLVNGQLFGQQIMLDRVEITRQQRKRAKGGLIFNDLALGPLLELHPELALAKQRPGGRLSGRVDVKNLPLDRPEAAEASAEVGTFWVAWRGFRLSAEPIERLGLSGGTLDASRISLRIATPTGREGMFDVTGAVRNIVGKEATLDLDLNLRPIELSSWAMLLPGVSQVEGTLEGRVHLGGPLSNVRPTGGLSLNRGRFELRRQGLAFNDVNVQVALASEGLILERASAALGGGTLEARGRAALTGMRLGQIRGQIRAQNVSIPVTPGVDLAIDANLDANWTGSDGSDEPSLPRLSGQVEVRSFEYSRAVTMNADIASLARRGKHTEFESYDPSKDLVELDVDVTSERPLRLNNNLIEANLRIERPGLQLTGTNQRFGLRGRMRFEPGGSIHLRRNVFEIESGEVRFDDSTTIAPRVDLRAATDYRRFGGTTTTGTAPGSGGLTDSASASGDWRISMHAHGDADNLKIDLTSQPKLSQDDIFLLLTVGLTRAELDQAQSGSVGESVALEALGSLTGADSAVTDAIPVIDEFRFGSSYSSTTGRTEPTVTVGKRLTQRIRAYVTSGISENREVRSNLEWRLNRRLSVEGSYDNIDDVSSSSLGNLGADVRWRLEFR